MTGPAPDLPSTVAQTFRDQQDAWTLIADVLGGTAAVRKKAALYLTKNPGEGLDNYNRRIKRTELFPGLQRTIKGLTGIALRSPPTLEADADQRLLDHAEDMDGMGTHAEVFARRLFGRGLGRGWCAVLVDMPPGDPGTISKYEEAVTNRRPYWCMIGPEQFCSVRVDVSSGQPVLTRVTWKECTREAVGLFGEREVTRFRVFNRDAATGAITWEVWTPPMKNGQVDLTAAIDKWQRVSGPVSNQTRIPLAVFYADEPVGPFECPPPLLELAYSNLAHYDVRADRRTGLKMAACPILVIKGRLNPTEDVVVGPNSTLDVPDNGDAHYTEHSGTALGEVREELQDLLRDMAAQGLAILQRQTRSAETAEAKAMDKAEQDSTLAVAMRSLQDALEEAWGYHAAYIGAEPPEVLLSTDYSAMVVTPQEADSLSKMVSAGQLSLETMWAKLQERGYLPDTFDPKVEKDRLANDLMGPPPTGAADAAAAKGEPPVDGEPPPAADAAPPPGTPSPA